MIGTGCGCLYNLLGAPIPNPRWNPFNRFPNRQKSQTTLSPLDKVKRKWQDTEYVLSLFGSKGVRRRNYLNYVEEGIESGRRPELVGGGLIRSLGGWSEVFALRSRKEMHAFDSRILGDSDFVNEIKSALNDLIKKNVPEEFVDEW